MTHWLHSTDAINMMILYGLPLSGFIAVVMIINWLLVFIARTSDRRARDDFEPSAAANTVLDLWVIRKEKSYKYAFRCINCALAFVFVMIIIHGWVRGALPAIYFILLVWIAIHLNRLTLLYRVRRHLYGTTNSEARELMSFVIQNSDRDDFFNDRGRPRIFDSDSTDETVDGAEPAHGQSV